MNRSTKITFAIATLLLLVHAAFVLDGARNNGGVYDECVYPPAGLSYLKTADYRINPEHPPLLKLFTGLPWLGLGIAVAGRPGWAEAEEWTFGQDVLYRSGLPPQALLFRSRFMIALLSLALAATVFAVARRWSGDAAALAALALYALDPLAIAHGGLATTDLGAALFYFLAAIAIPWAIAGDGVVSLAGAGLALGAALASKFSTVPLAAGLALVSGVGAWREGRRARPILRGLAIAMIAAGLVAFVYGPKGPAPFIDGVRFLRHHQETGHGTYAFGRYATSGWWWYFPAAWLVKTPIPILLASASGCAWVIARMRRRDAEASWTAVFVVLFAVPALASPIQIGVRHLLPLVPFLAVWGGGAVAHLVSTRPRARIAIAALGVWLALIPVFAHPYELAYSNELFGGPKRTWRVLADSNVDWGQDLPRLAAELKRQPLRRVYLAYEGSADPAAYGLRYCRIPSIGLAPAAYDDGLDPSGREWIAISTTTLLDVMVEGHAAYAWLRERPMTRLVGTSIALYDITGDAEANRRVAFTAISFGELDAAEPALRRVVELEPGKSGPLIELARVQASLGRWKDAVATCGIAEDLAPPQADFEPCRRIQQARF